MRRGIVARLAGGEAAVSELAGPFDVSLPAITQHLDVLEGAGLITRSKRGRSRYCELVDAPLDDATEWLDHHRRMWTGQLESLAAYFTERSGR